MVIKEDAVSFEAEIGTDAPLDAIPAFLKKQAEGGFTLGFYDTGTRSFYKRKGGHLATDILGDRLIEYNGYLFFPYKQKGPGIFQINSIRTDDAIGI